MKGEPPSTQGAADSQDLMGASESVAPEGEHQSMLRHSESVLNAMAAPPAPPQHPAESGYGDEDSRVQKDSDDKLDQRAKRRKVKSYPRFGGRQCMKCQRWEKQERPCEMFVEIVY